MKVLMISTDRKILDAGSNVAGRMREYADIWGELHIIVFSLASHAGSEVLSLSKNCFVYPTRSRSKVSYVFDAVRIGRRIALDSRLSASDSVVTTQDPFETGIVGLALARKFSLRLNVQIHTDFLSPYFVRGSQLNRLRRFIAGYVLPRATSIRVVSERIRASLARDFRLATSDSIDVLPLYSEPIATSQSSERFPQFEKVVLMVSRLEKEKDIPSALRAFAVVEKSFEKIGLVIVGSGSMEAELAHLALSLGIGEKVVFLGWRDEAELSVIRASSDVFLSTSLYEGYGLSLVEAARAGMSIVSTDVGIAPELLSADRLAHPGDVEGVTRLLIEALQHGERFVASAEGLDRVTYQNKGEYLERLRKSLLV